MNKRLRAVTMLTAFAVLAGSIGINSTRAVALPPQPTATIPPIIGNSQDGVVRDVPAKYLGAINAFENNAIAEVMGDKSLPPGDVDAVKAWGRDAVRTQEFLDLLDIIQTSPASRTANDALVYQWFQNVYQQQKADQTQAALDQYLTWAGLDEAHLSDDPQSMITAQSGGYCHFHPPAALDKGIGIFGGKYTVSGLPQCNGGSIDQCAGLATGCPVPWPTVEQFEQWGTYLSLQKIFDDPVFSNQAAEVATGATLAGTMVATGVSTAIARAYAKAVSSTSGTLFSKLFPYAARVDSIVKGGDAAVEAAETAARMSAGVIRAGAIAFVVGTVITAIVTIALESWTIYEHQQIPIILKKARDDNKGVVDQFGKVTFSNLPDLSKVLAKDNGAGVLLTAFLTTTSIDVDPDCQLPTDTNAYSNFPCANAPEPASPSGFDDAFYVSSQENGGLTANLRDTIYTVNPADSSDFATANENSRLSGNGWFVTTKYDGNFTANHDVPTTPGATLQSMRLYYRDWNGKAKVAERMLVDGKPMFLVAASDDVDLGGCATPPTGGAVSKCLTDTIQYVQPNGTKMSATIVPRSDAGPTVDAVVPERAVAGTPVTLTARGRDSFVSHGPWTYTWTVPGVGLLHGSQVTTVLNRAGTDDIRLDVADVNDPFVTTQHFSVLVAQNTTVDVGSVPATSAAYGSSPQIWAAIHPIVGEGVQCSWNQSTGEIGCVSPTGSVQFLLDGEPLGDPVPVTPNFVPPCFRTDPGCGIFFGDNVVYAPTQSLPPITVAPGSHPTVTAVYYGDDKFVGSTSEARTYDVVPATPSVAMTSGTNFPSPTTPVTLSALVQAPDNPVGNPTGAPTGTVQFLANDGSPFLGPVAVNSDGTATLPNVTLKYVNNLAVRYNGDTNYAGVSSAATPITFAQLGSATVAPQTSRSIVGTDRDLTVTVLDAQGQPLPGASVVITPGNVSGTTGSDGKTTLAVTSNTSGIVTYSVAVNGVTDLASAAVTWGIPASVPMTDVRGEAGVPMSAPLSVLGTAPVTVNVNGLPSGLSYNAPSHSIVGTPTASGTTVAFATATNDFGQTTSQVTVIVVSPVAIDTTPLPNGQVGTAYAADVRAILGFGPYTYGATGLPAGLVLDATTGHISGTPTAAGPATVNVTVGDSLGGIATTSFSLTIAPRPADLKVSVTSSAFTPGKVGTYTVTIDNIGGSAASGPLSAVDVLPNGISFSGTTSTGWRCGVFGTAVGCTRSVGVNAGQRATLVLTVRVKAKPGSALTNSVSVTTPSPEATTANNTATLTTTVTR